MVELARPVMELDQIRALAKASITKRPAKELGIGIPTSELSTTFESLNIRISGVGRIRAEYKEKKVTARGLSLVGDSGCGKTSVLFAILNEFVANDTPVLYLRSPQELLEWLNLNSKGTRNLFELFSYNVLAIDSLEMIETMGKMDKNKILNGLHELLEERSRKGMLTYLASFYEHDEERERTGGIEQFILPDGTNVADLDTPEDRALGRQSNKLDLYEEIFPRDLYGKTVQRRIKEFCPLYRMC